jgi:hypothetical protein
MFLSIIPSRPNPASRRVTTASMRVGIFGTDATCHKQARGRQPRLRSPALLLTATAANLPSLSKSFVVIRASITSTVCSVLEFRLEVLQCWAEAKKHIQAQKTGDDQSRAVAIGVASPIEI